jgi:hypothetical protein
VVQAAENRNLHDGRSRVRRFRRPIRNLLVDALVRAVLKYAE